MRRLRTFAPRAAVPSPALVPVGGPISSLEAVGRFGLVGGAISERGFDRPSGPGTSRP